jgi:hypothetical protein
MAVSTEFISLRIVFRRGGGPFEYGNESSSNIKHEKFLDHLGND